MKKHILAGISMVALAAALQPAAAADLPVAYRAPQSYVIFTWTGFYFGAHGGGAWGTQGRDHRAVRVRRRASSAPPGTNIDVSGGLAGGQFGANYQAGSWVFGVEAGRQLGGSHRQHRVRHRHRRGRGELPREGRRARHFRRPARLRARPRPALRQGRHCLRQRQVRTQLDRRIPSQRDPLGLDGRAAASNTPSPTTGPPRSNTITSTSARRAVRFTDAHRSLLPRYQHPRAHPRRQSRHQLSLRLGAGRRHLLTPTR